MREWVHWFTCFSIYGEHVNLYILLNFSYVRRRLNEVRKKLSGMQHGVSGNEGSQLKEAKAEIEQLKNR